MRRVVLLALGAFALLAAVSFTNVAVFSVNASLPPGMKYAGADACRALAPSGHKVGFYVNTSSLYQGNAVWLKKRHLMALKRKHI
ncbi:hypothetical protein [Pyrobaculum neutrophilum]|uniref:hypothetical protein n=1 Tax=Pyrobaculum neutrophilum TaxID=70771 RepID=UPI0011E530B9|nr:hypothetical protein [Pyrobaculum neutrophilum]